MRATITRNRFILVMMFTFRLKYRKRNAKILNPIDLPELTSKQNTYKYSRLFYIS